MYIRFVLCLALLTTSHQLTYASLADSMYHKAEYGRAISLWQSMLTNPDVDRADIYFNMATAHAQLKNYPTAILLLERSLKYDYSPSHTHLNLKIIRAKHKVDERLEDFIFVQWLKYFAYTFSIRTIQILAIVLAWLVLGLYVGYRVYSKPVYKYSMIATIILMMTLWAMLLMQRHYASISDLAIVRSQAQFYYDPALKNSVKSARGGEKVQIIDRVDQAAQVLNSQDSSYWILSSNLVVI